MKKWKQELINELNKLANDTDQINLYEVVSGLGFKNIKDTDLKEIEEMFLAGQPEFKVYRFKNEDNKTNILFYRAHHEDDEDKTGDENTEEALQRHQEIAFIINYFC